MTAPSMWFCLLSMLLPGFLHAAQEATEATEAPTELSARLVAARPKIRPGEWFPVAFVIEFDGANAEFLGPPDDGILPPQDAPQTDTLLLWSTNEEEDYRLLPDLTAIQWPRTAERDGYPRGLLELPVRIFIPVKAAPKAIPGNATLIFEVEGALAANQPGSFNLDAPVHLSAEVLVEIVHPTDPEATDVATVDPLLFAGWRGELPDWSVMDTRVSRPKRAAPLITWLVIAIPVGVVVLVLLWAFATKRL